MNFYSWIREGVRHAVLMGFHDAVEQIGTPQHSEESNQQLLTLLRENAAAQDTEAITTSASRKRLGRSLDQVAKSGSKKAA
jgi:hypothetical protein